MYRVADHLFRKQPNPQAASWISSGPAPMAVTISVKTARHRDNVLERDPLDFYVTTSIPVAPNLHPRVSIDILVFLTISYYAHEAELFRNLLKKSDAGSSRYHAPGKRSATRNHSPKSIRKASEAFAPVWRVQNIAQMYGDIPEFTFDKMSVLNGGEQ